MRSQSYPHIVHASTYSVVGIETQLLICTDPLDKQCHISHHMYDGYCTSNQMPNSIAIKKCESHVIVLMRQIITDMECSWSYEKDSFLHRNIRACMIWEEEI